MFFTLTNTLDPHNYPNEVDTIIISILQLKKLKYREIIFHKLT
jgi:hypothetical protein